MKGAPASGMRRKKRSFAPKPKDYRRNLAVFAVAAAVVVFAAMLLVFPPSSGGEPQPGEDLPETTVPAAETTTTSETIYPGSVQMLVSNAAGSLISGAWAEIEEIGASAVTEPDGSVVFSGIDPGQYSASVSAAGYLDSSSTFTIVSGGRTVMRIVLQPKPAGQTQASGYIVLSIIDVSSREPLAGAGINVSDSVGKSFAFYSAGPNGTASIALPIGGYYANISADGYLSKKTNFIVREGSANSLLIGLAKIR